MFRNAFRKVMAYCKTQKTGQSVYPAPVTSWTLGQQEPERFRTFQQEGPGGVCLHQGEDRSLGTLGDRRRPRGNVQKEDVLALVRSLHSSPRLCTDQLCVGLEGTLMLLGLLLLT